MTGHISCQFYPWILILLKWIPTYRLCKVPKEGMIGLTEECFNQSQLQFYGDMQWIEFGDRRIEFEAVRTRSGTYPEGSQWTRNPIPNCHFATQMGPDGEKEIRDYYLGSLSPDPIANYCR